MMQIVQRLMERATVTAAQVATDVADAVEHNRFQVIPHGDARMLSRLKRLSPEWYFRKALKATASFVQRR